MLEEAAAAAPVLSLWAAVAEWFTPTVLFVLLNVVIGTIAVTSKAHSSGAARGGKAGAVDVSHHQQYGTAPTGGSGGGEYNHHQYHAAAPPVRQLSRTGSMLQRLKSFNLNFHMYRGYRPEVDYGGAVAVVEPPSAGLSRTAVVERSEFTVQQQPAAQKKKQKQQQEVTRRREATSPRPHPRQLQRQQQQEEENHHLEVEEPDDSFADAAEFETLEEAFLAASGGGVEPAHLNRIQSDSKPTGGEMPRKLAATMKKSASTKSAFSHFEPQDLPRRPATTREDRRRNHLLDPSADDCDDSIYYDDAGADDAGAATTAGLQEAPAQHAEVDARADDFINRFRQQLKLQRLESLMRYRDMLNRGR